MPEANAAQPKKEMELTMNKHPERGMEYAVGVYILKGSPMVGLRADDIASRFGIEVEVLDGDPNGFRVGDEFMFSGEGEAVQAFLRQYSLTEALLGT